MLDHVIENGGKHVRRIHSAKATGCWFGFQTRRFLERHGIRVEFVLRSRIT
jgi:hypothetical protein